MEEQQLVQELKAKNETAFTHFVAHYKDRVYNTVLSILQNREEAEDLSQEIFIDIWNKVGSFRGESSLSTWVYQVAVNRCRDHLKWKKRKKRFAFIRSLSGEAQEMKHQIPDFVHPGVQMEQRERAKALFKAIKKLPESQRVAFSLHKLEGLSYQEIAGIMDRSLGSVESLMHRAKQNLQKMLYALYHDK